METLTREEKATLARYLAPPRSTMDTITSYGVYIAPSLAFALYGISKGDFAAVAVAYFVLLVVCVLYVSYQHGESPAFRSALNKLLDRLEQLEPSRPSQESAGSAGEEVIGA